MTGRRFSLTPTKRARLVFFATAAALLLFPLSTQRIQSAQAATLETQISVGSGPRRVATNPQTNRVYVTNTGSSNVSVIDGSSNAVIATVAVGTFPFGVATNPQTNRVYVTNLNSNNVSVVVDHTLDEFADKFGNPDLVGVCTEGSLRPGFQLYLTLASSKTQKVRIDYLTNYGTVSRIQNLNAGQRFTEDVNATLPGLLSSSGVSFDPSQLDTSIRVIGEDRHYMACPFYFSRSIGQAGPVAGGHVQDSTRG
ncbi:MAG: hypothetical protein C4317_00185 [Acidimicrobiia bacterium]